MVPFGEDDLAPVSALQHLMFCERQCALIHLEQLWADNRLTVEGSHLHERVDAQDTPERRKDVRVVRSLPLRSFRLGLIGRADVVEFRGQGGGVPFPIEYKRGQPKRNRCDEVQLCAQALCLEEMLNVEVSSGALYYGRPRRRTEVRFDVALRALTEDTAVRLHRLLRDRVTPRARREPKCERCSLIRLCMPDAIRDTRSASAYLRQAATEHGL